MYALLLVPAILGAVLDWPWWLNLYILMPGLILGTVAGHRAAERRGLKSRSETPHNYLLAGLAGVLGAAIGIGIEDDRYLGLALAGLMITLNLAERAIWVRRDRQAGRSVASP